MGSGYPFPRPARWWIMANDLKFPSTPLAVYILLLMPVFQWLVRGVGARQAVAVIAPLPIWLALGYFVSIDVPGLLVAWWLGMSVIAAGSSWLLGRAAGVPTLWLAPLVVLAVSIGVFSGDQGGAGGMAEWLQRTFGWEHEAAERVVVVARKGAHLVFYGLLGFSAARLLRSLRLGEGMWLCALLVVLAHAVYDEARQLSTPGRTGSAWDVGIDLIGGLLGVWLALRVRP